MTPQISRIVGRAIRWTLAGCCLVVTGCSNDSNTPDDTPAATLAEGGLPGVSNDVSDGSGEGGNRGGAGDGAPTP